VVGTELMPRLVGGDIELASGKLKKGNGVFDTEFRAGSEPIARTMIVCGK
jgi:hypothetical protein